MTNTMNTVNMRAEVNTRDKTIAEPWGHEVRAEHDNRTEHDDHVKNDEYDDHVQYN